MLGVLCARPKPNWTLNSLFAHFLLHHHHHQSNDRLSLHLSDSFTVSRRHHSSLCSADCSGGGASAIWHVVQPADWRRRERRSVRGEGSWNVAWDGRPARWLHRPVSALLLFSVCACLAPAIEFFSDVNIEEGGNVVVDVDHQEKERSDGDDLNASAVISDDVEQDSSSSTAGSDYKVTGVLADGRCLFRAIAHMACLINGEDAPDENRQRELADELRAQVVDELLKRREETEWFIEGDFDAYVKRIQQPYVWGGEPELLMASHVLKTMISVFMRDRTTGNLVSIANYGEEYRKDEVNPINVLFHGYGHYDILETTPGQSYKKRGSLGFCRATGGSLHFVQALDYQKALFYDFLWFALAWRGAHKSLVASLRIDNMIAYELSSASISWVSSYPVFHADAFRTLPLAWCWPPSVCWTLSSALY